MSSQAVNVIEPISGRSRPNLALAQLRSVGDPGGSAASLFGERDLALPLLCYSISQPSSGDS